MNIPKDPFILFSWINTQLRDTGRTLAGFCAENQLDPAGITETLEKAGFRYDAAQNRFR